MSSPILQTGYVFFFDANSAECVDRFCWRLGFSDFFWDILMEVMAGDGLGVLARVDFFLVQGLGMGIFFKVIIFDRIEGKEMAIVGGAMK